MKYRSDIDGLRAIAVTSVIVNHAAPNLLPSGFIGVDIFFVISGFLITGILLEELSDDKFTISGFYERRIRRIAPALLIVVGACVPLAYALMNPIGLGNFSQSMAATLAFVPNVFFWRTVSYFDPTAETLPLLHTWSLGIEEQFYLVFPPLLAYLWRRGQRLTLTTLVVIALASLIVSEYWWRSGKGALAFYLPLSRAWELLAGSLAATISHDNSNRSNGWNFRSHLASGFGIILLIGSFLFIDKTMPLPSVYTIAPVMGTTIILLSNTSTSLVFKALSIQPFVSIGLVSFSAYLWHQPVFAFFRIYNGNLRMHDLPVALVVVAILSYATWRFVEQPFRSRTIVTRDKLQLAVGTAFGTLVFCAGAGIITDGLAFRLGSEQIAFLKQFDKREQGRYVEQVAKTLEARQFEVNPKPKVLIVGDSFAQDFVNITYEAGILDRIDPTFFYISGDCQPVPQSTLTDKNVDLKYRPACKSRRRALSELSLVSQADLVVVASYWRPWSTKHMTSVRDNFIERGAKKVIFIGMKDFGEPDPNTWIRQPSSQRSAIRTAESTRVGERNSELLQAVGKSSVQLISESVCSARLCRAFTASGQLISFDGAHLTKFGAAELGRATWGAPPLSDWVDRNLVVPKE